MLGKARAKKVLAKAKRAAKLTGGGVSISPEDEQSSAIASIIPAQIDSLQNPFDDDNYESGKDMLWIMKEFLKCNVIKEYTIVS